MAMSIPVPDSNGFVIVPHSLWQTVPPRELRVYCALCSFADYNTGLAWPSRSTLADMLGVSTDTIDRALRNLESAGWVRKTRRTKDDGDWDSNLYELPWAVGNRFRGSRKTAATQPQNAPGGSRKTAAQTKTMNEREGFTFKLPFKDCSHNAADEDGYCTACGYQT